MSRLVPSSWTSTLLVALLLPPASAAGQPLSRERVPEPLRPWVDWVLHGREGELCPFLHGPGSPRCAWPGSLTLELDEGQGRFSQTWTLDAESLVPLPGDQRRWPQELTVDGEPGVAVARSGAPRVLLAPGTHRLRGTFRWDRLPDFLPVPPETGLVELVVRGAAVPFPRRDEAGRLWLRETEAPEAEGERLEVTVHRRLIDEIPLRLVTRVELSVSGRAREVALAPPLPEGLLPLALEGPLPARLEPDGRLRVQVRPGRWTLTLTARSEAPVERLGPGPPDGPWAAEEVWVFDPRPDLRLVDVEGVPAIDPRQTALPEEWKSLPAFRLAPGDALTLAERRRGDQDPPPDRLTLHRVLWLDFDGGGVSVQDQMSGVLRRSWRLEMGPPATLERVVVDGVDQVLTRRGGSEAVGLEVRQGNLRLAAESRIGDRPARLPAVGWDHDFQQVTADLHLPPGWRLLAAAGVDDAAETWVGRWTLLDLFLVLILALVFHRLWGRAWGVLALVTLGLIYHEGGAPVAIFLPVVAVEALLRWLPREGRARRFFRAVFWAAVGVLILIAVPFLVQQVRQGMYPVLERPWTRLGEEGGGWQDVTQLASQGTIDLSSAYDALTSWSQPVGGLARQAPPVETAEIAEGERPVPAAPAAEKTKAELPGRGAVGRLNLQDLDPGAVVNTGAGLPRWGWHRVRLTWSGPVERAQHLRLFLLSPGVGFAFMVVRVLLLCLLVVRVLGLPGSFWPRALKPAVVAAAAVLFALAAVPGPVRAQTPPPEMLEELGRRLLEKPPCHPRCAESPRLVLEAGASALRVRLEVGAEAATAVPLPGGAPHWTPSRVLVDGGPAGVARGPDGTLWVRLAPGRHLLLVEGPLPDREVVQLPLPLVPHRVEARVSGWALEGVGEDGVPEAGLRLVRERPGPAGPEVSLEAQTLPPLLEVERTLILGLRWQVATRVRRLSPPGAPVLVEIPLLPGESVTTEGVRVEEGRVRVGLAPGQGGTGWSSDLEIRPAVELAAPQTRDWVEVWRLDASPVWHVEMAGIPPVHPGEKPEVRQPEWRPWPGEAITLGVSRPAGVDGRSLTLDRSLLVVEPGRRSLEARLELDLRSSRGGRHEIRLPEGAELLALTVDGRAQPLREEAGRVVLPVSPGSQTVAVSWREDRGASTLFRTPRVEPGLPGVNALVRLQPPAGRWLLATGGPRVGPVVLFWSLLVVVLLVAVGLGRVPLTPLGTVQWALLGVGLTQVPLPAAATVAVWLLALGLRRRHGPGIGRNLTFDLFQVLLVVLTSAALLCLFWGVQKGLLGRPEMQIAGNGSHAGELRWFADRSGEALPAAWVVSVPLLVYRLAMLAWALWLAGALLRWLRWGWGCFTEGGLWRRVWRRGEG